MEQHIIKFRAWIRDFHMMVEVDTLHLCGGIEFGVPVTGNGSMIDRSWLEQDSCDDATEYELMQFTGLTDKNGTEIYEGDIVSFDGILGGRGKSQVHWSGDRACFLANGLMPGPVALEVIGNVWQKPELLDT